MNDQSKKIVKTAGPLALLNLVPALLGHVPHSSLVAVLFTGSRSAGALRFDLPEIADQASFAQKVGDVLLGIHGRDGVAFFVFTDEEAAPHLTLLELLDTHAQLIGHRVEQRLWVGSEGWGSQMDGTGPFPLTDFQPTLVEGVDAPLTDQHRLAPAPVIDIALREAIDRRMRALPGYDDRCEWISLAQKVGDTGFADLDAWDLAYLLEGVCTLAVRDVMLITWAAGTAVGVQASDAQDDFEQHGTAFPAELASILVGETDVVPRRDALHNVLQTMRALQDAYPTASGAGVVGWLQWSLGKLTHAVASARSGLEIEPGHVFCTIVLALAQNGRIAGWMPTFSDA